MKSIKNLLFTVLIAGAFSIPSSALEVSEPLENTQTFNQIIAMPDEHTATATFDLGSFELEDGTEVTVEGTLVQLPTTYFNYDDWLNVYYPVWNYGFYSNTNYYYQVKHTNSNVNIGTVYHTLYFKTGNYTNGKWNIIGTNSTLTAEKNLFGETASTSSSVFNGGNYITMAQSTGTIKYGNKSFESSLQVSSILNNQYGLAIDAYLKKAWPA